MHANKLYHHKPLRKGNKKYILFLGLIIVFLSGAFILIKSFKPKIWSDNTKLSIVTMSDNNDDIFVWVLDKKTSSITKISIPGTTMVEVSGDLGEWKLKSVWQLGVDKGKKELLANTLVKNFSLPIFGWGNRQLNNIFSPDISSSLKVLFSESQTNLSFGDKLKVLIFSISTKGRGRTDIDLSDSKLLEPVLLEDGSDGFKINSIGISPNIKLYFTQDWAMQTPNVSIINESGRYGIDEEVGSVIDTLGGKVVSMSKYDTKKYVCVVSAKDDRAIRTIIELWGCTKESWKEGLDINIRIGSEFPKKF